MNPPGRFLMIDPIRNVWNEIGDEKACDKTTHALRETTTAMGGVEKSISTFTPDVEMVVEMDTGKTTTMATVAVTAVVNNGSDADGDEGCGTAEPGEDQKEGVERTAGTTTTFILDTEKQKSDTTTGMAMTTGMPTSMMAATSTTKSFTPIIMLLQQQVRAAKKHKMAQSTNMPKPTKKLKVAYPTTKETGQELINSECSRAVSFDQLPKSNWGTSKSKDALFIREKLHPSRIMVGNMEEKTALNGRAARARNRQMIKNSSEQGNATKFIDRLAGRDREHQLRFDKSQIHGCGVYAENQINCGDLIIEYIGEIIRNAVADKREKEYEKANLNDYFFRIDANTVCDATRSGNVARYINASCSPNCYAKIIAVDNNKRIVIYAKRDIQPGEELCYDYKFSPEYDPLKRIPCNCGSKVCRRFLNWDKKFDNTAETRTMPASVATDDITRMGMRAASKTRLMLKTKNVRVTRSGGRQETKKEKGASTATSKIEITIDSSSDERDNGDNTSLRVEDDKKAIEEEM